MRNYSAVVSSARRWFPFLLFRSLHIATVTLSSTAVLALSLVPVTAHAQCPAVNADTGCGTVITVTNNGALVSSTGQGPYDGSDDTLVGVINNSSQAVSALDLSSAANVFSFDGDGIDTFGVAGNSQDGTGYGGPNAYFTGISADATSGAVNFIAPIAANGGTAYFSLENALASAVSCSSLINNAVSTPSLGGAGLISGYTNISASFTPNNGFTLDAAAQLCGFTEFDWIQRVVNLPDPSPFFAVNPSNPATPTHLTSLSTPFNDPAPNGYTYNPNWNSYPFYWDINSTANPWSLAKNENTTTLSSYDAPTDPCISGPLGIPSIAYISSAAVRGLCGNATTPRDSYLEFTTHLAGVKPDGTGVDLGIGYTWTSNYNGTTGGIATTASYLPSDPNSGSGGITVISVQEITSYQYNGIIVTGVNGGPAVTAASIASVTPVQGSAGSNSLTVTLVGESTNFATGSTVVFSGAGITVTAVTVSSPTNLTATINIDGTAALGSRDVTVTTGAEVAAGAGLFLVVGPPPVVTSAAPGQGVTGSNSLMVTLVGENTNFATGSTVVFSGAGITVTAVTVSSPTNLTATINIDGTAAVGSRDVAVSTGMEVAVGTGTFQVVAPSPPQTGGGGAVDFWTLLVLFTMVIKRTKFGSPYKRGGE